MYGSSAWWGFTSAIDRQKVKAFIRQRSIRAGFYTSHPDYDFQELCNEQHVQHDFTVSISCTGTNVATRFPTKL